jgi:antitoxin component of MazEF toxin-antitoxin module
MSKHQILGKSVRKLVKVGNSIGITLPTEYLKAHNLKVGESMEICFNEILRVEPLNLERIKKAVERGDDEERKPQT